MEEVEERKVNIAFINFFYNETCPFKERASSHNGQWLDFRISKKPNDITNFNSLMGCGSIWHGDHSFPSSFGILLFCTFLLHSTTSSFKKLPHGSFYFLFLVWNLFTCLFFLNSMKEVFALFMLDVFAKKFKKSRATSLHKKNCSPSTQLIPLSNSKLIKKISIFSKLIILLFKNRFFS